LRTIDLIRDAERVVLRKRCLGGADEDMNPTERNKP
jgi:hypothetical protein